MTGTIPDGACSMKAINYFGLEDNYFHGFLPSCMGQLQNLVDIALQDNAFTSSLPSSMASIRSLRFFAMNSNRFSGIVPKFNWSQYLVNDGHCDLSSNAFQCPLPPQAAECKAACSNQTIVSMDTADDCFGASANLASNDCLGWQKLFDSTQGLAWYDCATRRNDPCSCNSTNGNSVICESGHITSIRLSNNNMIGTIPEEVGLIPSSAVGRSCTQNSKTQNSKL